jgi:elongation factor Tu
LTISTLGGTGHGKTTLTAAIAKVVSRIGSAQIKEAAIDSQEPLHHSIMGRMGISYRAIDYETSGRHYTQIDCLSHADNVKMLISGSPAVRGAILVVSVVDGVTEETATQIRLASQTRLPAIVTFLNKSELVTDPELIELCEMEIRELLTTCGYGEGESPILVGDAAKALKYSGNNLGSEDWKPIVDLIFTMNRSMPQPSNRLELPLMMPIREVIDAPKGGSTVRGEILQGRLAVGYPIDIVGKGERIKTRCVGMRSHTGRPASDLTPQPLQGKREGSPPFRGSGKFLSSPREGAGGEVENEHVEIQVDSEPGWISPGQVVSEPKSLKSYTDFGAVVYVMTQEECGTHIPLVGNDKPEIHLWTIDVPGHLRLSSDLAIINPGEQADVQITLDVPMAMQIGTRFQIKKMGLTIGMGVVTEIAA